MTENQDVIIKTAGGAIYAPSWEAVAKLNARLVELLASVGSVEKDGFNPHFKYNYQSYEAVALAVRGGLTKVGLSFTVGVLANESDGNKRTVTIEVTLGDPDTGAMRLFYWQGEGQDTQDKGTAKALTSAVKYMLMRNLLITSTDEEDPDAAGPLTQANIAKSTTEDAVGFRQWPENKRKAFWATTHDLGFDQGLIHAAFGVESLNDYQGTMADAKRTLFILKYGVTERALSIMDVQQALGHPVAECQSSVDAKAMIDAWVEKQAETERPVLEEDDIPF